MTSTRKTHKLTAYIVYLPTFMMAGSATFPSGFSVGGKQVRVGVGGPSDKFGSLLGIGVHMGSERQLWRMDPFPVDPNHGNGASTGTGLGVALGELAVLKRSGYHTHVYKWAGGPR